jgi:chromosome segregation ATPase
VLEETSTSLGSQVMYLRSKLEKTEAALSEANREMHVARMNGQTKMTTIENLTQQLQNVTMENCRLSKDKTGLEDNIRQLTSILQAMTALDTSRAIGGPDENKNMLRTSEELSSLEVHVNCHDNAFQIGKLGPNREEQPLPDNDMLRTVEENAHASVGGVGGPADRAPFSPKNDKPDIKTKDRISPIRGFMESGVAKQINNTCSLNKGAEYQDNCLKRKETTSDLEKELLQLNIEKEKLDIELSRMPFNSAGKTVAQRQRRKYVDSRLGEISKNISQIKRQLRHLNAL